MKESIVVPRDRINVIKDGKCKKMLQRNLGVKLSFADNSVEIEGEGLELFQAKKIVKAIGRGFSPIRAGELFGEDKELEIIDLEGFGEKRMRTIKSRIIGTNGKTRNIIEFSTECLVSVYGNTASIIGSYEKIQIAKGAIGKIIDGASHKAVYAYLRKASGKE